MCVLRVLFQTPFSTEIRIQNPRASLLPVILMLTTYCVTLGKLVNISEPHIPDFKMEKQYLLHGIAVRTK